MFPINNPQKQHTNKNAERNDLLGAFGGAGE